MPNVAASEDAGSSKIGSTETIFGKKEVTAKNIFPGKLCVSCILISCSPHKKLIRKGPGKL